MRVRRAAPLALVALTVLGATHAEAAKPKKKPKPITKSYSVTALPHPYPPSGPSCSDSAEGVSEHREEIKVTGPGKLVVTVTGFTGDWDSGLYDKNGNNLQMGQGSDTPNTSTDPAEEVLKYPSKKAQTLYLDVCNFIGSPTAQVKYVYTYN
jgi:hypothetical protein